MTSLEKAIIDICEKLHEGLSSVEDQTAEGNDKLEQVLQNQAAQGVLLQDIMAAVGSLSDLVRHQYSTLSEGLSSLGARVRTSEQLMKQQRKSRPLRVVEQKSLKGRNESDDR